MLNIGYIAKTSGYEGFVTISLTEPNSKKYFTNIEEPVFLQIEGKQVPFFVESSIIISDTTVRVKFDDYNTLSAVTPFVGCSVFLENIKTDEDSELSIDQLIGYTVVANGVIIVGRIADIYNNRSQYLMSVINNQEKEILIPLHSDLIEDIDKEKQTLFMQLPEGLF